ncbi:hypothetical protein KAU33_06265 [Candidatus Dependentiae bacterium]|nr:hypothetical protein [Candidatus Dependentiae bacterium]
MRKSVILMLCLTFLICLPVLTSAKDTVAVFDFENLGLSEQDYTVAMHLLRDEIGTVKSFKLISKSKVKKIAEGKPVEEIDDAVKFGKELNADKCIIGSFVPLGTKVIIRVKLIDVKSGSLEFHDEVESKSVEDMNIVFKRIAVGLESKEKFATTATTDTITEDESLSVRKRTSFHCYGMKLGYLYPQEDSYGGKTRLSNFVFTWQFEIPNLISEFSFGMSGASGVLETAFDISFLYPLSKKDFSPYIGGGIGIHSLRIEKEVYDPDYWYSYDEQWETENGFCAHGGVGVIMFRTYNFRVVFDLRAYYSSIKVGGQQDQLGVAFTFGVFKKKWKSD